MTGGVQAVLGEIPRGGRAVVYASWSLALLAMLLLVGHAVGLHLPGLPVEQTPEIAVSLGAVGAAASCASRAVLVEAERRPWTILACGVGASTTGWLVWTTLFATRAAPPLPSVADVLWIGFYPCVYVGFAMLLRRSFVRAPGSMWLDGLLAGLAVSAVALSFAFKPLEGGGQDSFALGTAAVYALGDLLLLIGVLTVVALSSWRPGPRWLALGGAMLAWFVADANYLAQTSAGEIDMSTMPCLLWLAGFTLIGLAAWQRQQAPEVLRVEGLRMLLVPSVFSALALGTVCLDRFTPTHDIAVALALAAIAVALARTTLTLREVQLLADARHESLTDELTGLPSRRHFHRRMDAVLREADAENLPVGLLLFDLDRFKELNDTLGHGAGDVLLQLVGRRLKDALGRSALLARLGGDEFAVLLPPGTGRDETLRVADKVCATIERPFEVEGLELDIGASVGVALYPEHAGEEEELVRRADVAMYLAKGAGGGVALYDPDRDLHTRDRLALGRQLRAALERDELLLYYQPKVDPQLGRVLGVEAVVRWQHPTHGVLMPPDFLPVAGRSGLMPALTRRVLELSLRQLARWRADGLDLSMAVNLAVADIIDEDLPRRVARLLVEHDVPPTCLVVEVTEDGLIADPVAAAATLNEIAALGVRIALDDFGTGFSSLAHLRRLPVDELKIDRSFVRDMVDNEDDAAIVRTTVDLARSLRKRVVAEGVEDERTWTLLAELGCDAIQGYVLSRPLPAAALTAWLAGRREGAVARCAVPGSEAETPPVAATTRWRV